jgi:predicted nucleotide-binding protein (sugar kinase/HSP70/actin superfamily)
VAIDLLEKKLLQTRPYERYAGETDKAYRHFLQKTFEVLRDRGDLVGMLRNACRTLNSVSLNGHREKPVVGVVGEIYVRSNRFANENAVREIEALGGEVWMPPISEWMYYVNYCSKKRALNDRRYRYYATVLLKEFFQHRDEHRRVEVFQGSLRNLKEPSITRTIDMACGYLHPTFEGEAILSLGKSIDFINKGASGLVNIMPFTCLPGTVVNSLIGRFRAEHDHIPFLNLAYDGQEQTHTRTRLEAFMYQVRQFQHRNQQK